MDQFAELAIDRCLTTLRLGQLHYRAIDVIDFGQTALKFSPTLMAKMWKLAAEEAAKEEPAKPDPAEKQD